MKKYQKNKSKNIIITFILCIILLTLFSTIAYSAFSSTMNITGLAHSRVEADVRITNFSLDELENATSSYEEFSKEITSSQVIFEENAYVIYKVEVTNYGSTDIGIYEITGIPENVSYELIDYKLKDKLCNINGKCNSYATKIFYIKIMASNLEIEFTLNYIFEPYHQITYTNFTYSEEYPNSILNNDTITIDLSKDKPGVVFVKSLDEIEYKYVYDTKVLTLYNVSAPITIEAMADIISKYSYTGATQTFTAPYDGVYRIELWGAQGGSYSDGSFLGGLGGYTSGEISLSKGTKLNVIVGSIGSGLTGGYNGGASTMNGSYGRAGGGATDIRTTTSTLSRIMVAAGGGGAAKRGENYGDGNGGYGGGLTGGTGTSINNSNAYGYGVGYGGEQIQGGKLYWTEKGSGERPTGYYETINHSSSPLKVGGVFFYGNGAAAGGGGGYYGGAGSFHGGAGGGSSFVSGHNGCNAISESSTTTSIIHTGQSVHYSVFQFKNTKVIDGGGYNWTTTKGNQTGMPTHDGTSTMTGNSGNGYAKITLIDTSPEYNIVYENIPGNYQTTIKHGKTLNVDFKENAPPLVNVKINDTLITNYTYKNGKLTIENVSGYVKIQPNYASYTFSYTGGSQTFTVPYKGIYKVELWGAQGGNMTGTAITRGGSTRISSVTYTGGLGAYTSGKIELNQNDKLYVYVGSKPSGTGVTLEYGTDTGGYNGGASLTSGQGVYGAPGGGATDIRLVSGTWSTFSSLKSRIMVAAGGGGSNFRNAGYGEGNGGEGGGLLGYGGYTATSSGAYDGTYENGYVVGYGGTQTRGGKTIRYYYTTTATDELYQSGFGKHVSTNQSGGGGGYYTGGSAGHAGAGGGSSFISGHNGCDAITEASTESNIIHTDQSVHYSGYSFTDTVIIDGKGYKWTTEKGSQTGMPTHDGTSTMTGNTGNGYAKITLIELT